VSQLGLSSQAKSHNRNVININWARKAKPFRILNNPVRLGDKRLFGSQKRFKINAHVILGTQAYDERLKRGFEPLASLFRLYLRQWDNPQNF
jgi:hypothetical protein